MAKKQQPCKLKELITAYISAEKAVRKVPSAPAVPETRSSYKVADWNKYQADFKVVRGQELFTASATV